MSLRNLKSFIALLGTLVMQSATAGEISVAVAANFTAPMQKIVDRFQKESGHVVKASFGSTGKFYTQVRSGAPFDVFVSADSATPEKLEQEGLAVHGSRFVYALGKVVLWSAQPGLVDGKGEVLGKGSYGKLAIADPRLAPYGQAAQETLQNLGLWDKVQSRLVKGENISQAYQFTASGNAELGFVALSQVTRDGRIADGSWWVVPANFYQPIQQSAVMLSGAKDQAAAKALLEFMKGREAAAIIRSFGYELP